MTLKPGDTAPDFTARASDGAVINLAALTKNSRVVLVFYPGDNTPVCTSQLCAFRDSMSDLKSLDCTVLGVNPAGESKHSAFISKYNFPFPLVVDERGEIARRYGCRAMFGLIVRTVFVIDTNGKVIYAKRGNPPVKEIVDAVKSAEAK